MAKRLTDGPFELRDAVPAPDAQLDVARQVLCERGYSRGVALDE